MRTFLSERNIVVVLFIMVIVVFSFAQKDTRRMEEMYINNTAPVSSNINAPESPAEDVTMDNAGNQPFSTLR